MIGSKCVVCEGTADVYCRNDDAALCFTCDERVHSANPLAERHQRIPISKHNVMQVPPTPIGSSELQALRPCPQVESHTEESPFVDDDFCTVPDVFSWPDDKDDPFNPRALMGKDLFDEDDIFDLDPTWMDRLDVGLERMPSDMLDCLVPEAVPTKSLSVPKDVKQPQHVPPAQSAEQNTQPIQNVPTSNVVTYVHSSPPQVMLPAYHHPVPIGVDASEAILDIDNYVPRSLVPVDPEVRNQLMKDRKEKVMRFREKKKTRHFKKTIRYASRKAYAEVRPRIKGRFARKDEVAAMRAAGLLPVL